VASAADSDPSEIVVTGSLIRGAAENAAAPVDVISAAEISRQGRPSTLELLKQLPITAGTIGETNPYQAGRGNNADGMTSVNLRGFGPERTLVLLNGKRLPPNQNGFVDANMIPSAVIGRVEVLKDGGAVTYGSDAISGVVNFITRKDIKGLEASTDYRWIPGSDGDYGGSLAWGWSDSSTHVILSAGYQHRSRLSLTDRDWAVQSFGHNPQGAWTGGAMPSRFVPISSTYQTLGAARLDPGCSVLGEVLTNPVAGGAPASQQTPGGFTACRGNYGVWSNLVDERNIAQFYGEAERDISDSVKLHIDGLFSRTVTPHAGRAPSFVTSRGVPSTALPAGISGLDTSTSPSTLSSYFVPATNPGLVALKASNPELFPAGTSGVYLPVGSFRPFLSGGSPLTGYDSGNTRYERNTWRVSAELSGDLGDGFLGKDLKWNFGGSYSRYKTKVTLRDTINARLELALRGLGGPNCNYLTGTPGAGGCLYYNPFSNGIAGSPPFGTNNPNYQSTLSNGVDLQNWLMPLGTQELTNGLLTVDAGLGGDTGFELPGGSVKWAVGAQYRRSTFKTDYSVFNSAILSPCVDFPINGNVTCTPQPQSPLVSEPGGTPVNLTQGVYAVYGELSLPFFDTLNATLAARYEDYGNKGGSTFNPQFRAKWQAVDWFALRGSVGTTFRAPPPLLVSSVAVNGVQPVFGNSIPVSVQGNANLKPEKSTSFNVGTLFSFGRLRASVDFWHYKFKDLLTPEPLANVLTAGFGAGGPCTGDAAFLAAHFIFRNGVCNSNSLLQVTTTQINGPSIKTSGLDFMIDYSVPDVIADYQLGVGGSATYTREYKVGTLIIGGLPVAGSKFNAVGKANFNTVAYSLPRWKGQAYVELVNDRTSLRFTARYSGAYKDDRPAIFAYSAANQTGSVAECNGPFLVGGATVAPTVVSERCGTATAGSKIHATVLFDASFSTEIFEGTTLSATMVNMLDRDPSFARTEFNYDPATGEPLGRTVKFAITTKF
jgi:iron complex outermembrane receptor protein